MARVASLQNTVAAVLSGGGSVQKPSDSIWSESTAVNHDHVGWAVAYADKLYYNNVEQYGIIVGVPDSDPASNTNAGEAWVYSMAP